MQADLHRSLEARLNVVLTDAEVAVAGGARSATIVLSPIILPCKSQSFT